MTTEKSAWRMSPLLFVALVHCDPWAGVRPPITPAFDDDPVRPEAKSVALLCVIDDSPGEFSPARACEALMMFGGNVVSGPDKPYDATVTFHATVTAPNGEQRPHCPRGENPLCSNAYRVHVVVELRSSDGVVDHIVAESDHERDGVSSEHFEDHIARALLQSEKLVEFAQQRAAAKPPPVDPEAERRAWKNSGHEECIHDASACEGVRQYLKDFPSGWHVQAAQMTLKFSAGR